MASRHQKRSRSGKNIASSSAAPTPVFPYIDGSYLKFDSEEEYTRFITKFEKRDILPPHFSTIQYLESSAPAATANMLRESKLLDFLFLKHPHIHPPLIRAFYSNLQKDEDGDLVTPSMVFKFLYLKKTFKQFPHFLEMGKTSQCAYEKAEYYLMNAFS